MRTNLVKMSVAAAMLFGSSAYAGKIIGVDAGTPWDVNVTNPPQQYGFGGWNLDNIEVRMVDAETGEDLSLIFNESNGTYDPMAEGESFVSDIIGGDDNVTKMGELRGKDYPVGEPAGIKIINNDTLVKHGKPENCIMTTSYLSADKNPTGLDGYLNTVEGDPVPVRCSSTFQTHKRFKINMLPTSVDNVTVENNASAGGYGKPIDIVFNLAKDTNTTVRRYQVLQKINNYTGVRLNGYKMEVLDENGSKNPALTFSLGIGEETDENGTVTGDIWAESEWANMSHGLWGPADKHFPEPGFFDNKRVYYPVTLEDNQTISHQGPWAAAGGNYDEIFGDWLPSIWEPMGIFWDDDQDPNTDGVLMAFFGVAPGETELAWWKSSVNEGVYTWTKATEEDLNIWSGDWYTTGPIEDVLNLGLNYIIEVGENAEIGDTFILRLTPSVAQDQTPPVYYGVTPPTVEPTPTTPTTVVSSGGGGGCTYNPDSKNFDMMFLVMMAMGLLYPFRRRFIK